MRTAAVAMWIAPSPNVLFEPGRQSASSAAGVPYGIRVALGGELREVLSAAKV
jgi:hypothetical protein